MTRLYFHAGRLRLRVLLVLALCVGLGMTAVMAGFRSVLGIPASMLRTQLLVVGGVCVVLFAGLATYSWLCLRPVVALLRRIRDLGMVHPTTEDAAQRAALRFPLEVTVVALGSTIAAIVLVLIADFMLSRLQPVLLLGMGLGALAVTLVATAFLYVAARALLRPITAHFRHEEVPPGIRVSIHTKVTAAILALALAAVIPTTMVAESRVRSIQGRTHEQDQQRLAEALAYGATALDPEALRLMVATLRLSGNARVRFTDTSGPTASPLPTQHAGSYVEVLADRELSTGPGLLVIAVLFALALAIYVGRTLGHSLSQDITAISDRVAALAHPWSEGGIVRPLAPAAPQFADVRRLAAAVNNLLQRVAQVNVTHFVAIEKTIAADRVKMQFLANVSHDLRSPLNSILGFSELLLRDQEATISGRTRQAVTLIHAAGTELLRLIDEVLDSAKLEAGRITLHREDSLPAELVTQALKDVQRSGLPEGVSIRTELQAGLPMVWVDTHRSAQAIEHLVRHAIEAVGKQGDVVVRVRAESVDHEVAPGTRRVLQIRIADTSRGLEGDEVGRLFVGFRRRPGRCGLGLGLPLAKAFIELHNGTLQVFSTSGVGTTFVVDIPLIQKKALGRLRAVKV